MNILLINHYAGSKTHGMEYRPFYLAREWVRLGHQVSIAAASYSHLRNHNPEVSGEISVESIEGIRYLWIKTPTYTGNGMRRVLNMLAFSVSLVMQKTVVLNGGRPDVIIASSPHPFIVFGARELARASGARLCFEVRDLWPLTLTEVSGKSPRHPFIAMMQWTENYAYSVSEKVISLLPKADGYMADHGMTPNKFVYLPNGIDIDNWQSCVQPLPKEHTETLHELRRNKPFVVGYAGSHGAANALDSLVKAAALLRERPVAFVLVGEGIEKKALQDKTAALGLENVLFLSPVARASVPQLLEAMDALFIGWKNEPMYQYGISPNKLMDYMMSAKPVVHATNAANDLVGESGCGVSVPPEDPEAIAGAVGTLMDMTVPERAEMGLKGRQYVVAHHDYRVLAGRLLDALAG